MVTAFVHKRPNLILMDNDRTLTQIFAGLKIVGQIREKNLLNNISTRCNIKLYRSIDIKNVNDLDMRKNIHLKLMVCTGKQTMKGVFDLKEFNKKHNDEAL